MATHTLENDKLKVVINELGGVIDAFQYGREHPLDILRPRTEFGVSSTGEASMFPMVPMVNRIRGNRFEWLGRQVVLPINQQVDQDFFLHGDGWLSRWQLCQQNSKEGWLEIAMTSDIEGVCHYQAKQGYQLQQDSLTITMTLTNFGEEAFPFGAGFHPFFHCLPDTQVHFSALELWLEDAHHLPTEHTTAIPAVFNFEQEKALPKAWINNGYQMDKSGVNATLKHSNGLLITLTSPCRYLQVYKPEGNSNFLCLEPQSQAVNAHAFLPPLPLSNGNSIQEDLGLTILAPYQSMQITMTINVDDSLCQA
ncbi:aldose 1-epimerase [Vibrio parahaemolyticus]|uniref:aldose 1-epimerase n=1 Tax=Vibrio mediterranei TaxID=689 RepID=UPI00406849A1